MAGPPPATNDLEGLHETEGRPWLPAPQLTKLSTKATNAPKNFFSTDVSMPPGASPTNSTRPAPVLNLGKTDEEPSGSTAKYLFRAHQRLLFCWEDVKLLRDRFKGAWARYLRFKTFYLESRSLFDHSEDRVKNHYTEPTPAPIFTSLLHRMEDDRVTLQTQLAECERLEHELEQAQERFEHQGTVFMTRSRELLSRIGLGSEEDLIAELTVAQDEYPSANADSPLVERLDALLERYYDKAADLKLLGEQLLNCCHWYQVETSARGLKQDQGEVLIPSEQELEEEYSRKRSIIEQELDIAIAEADQLRRECNAAGLDVEAYRRFAPASSDLGGEGADNARDLPPEYSSAIPSADLFHALQGGSFETPLAEAEVIRGSPSSGPIDLSARMNPQVANWIANLSLSDLEGLPAEAVESTHHEV